MNTYKIAEIMVSMNPQYEPLKTQAIPYESCDTKSLDCIIPQGEEAIFRYQKKHPNLTIGECEYLLYGAFFYDTLLEHQGFFLHASAVVVESKAYLFSAPCGTGKSTHTRIWKKVFPDAIILNDDKPAVKLSNRKFFAYGTPFSGKTDLNINASYPIQGICFLERGLQNSIKLMDAKEIIIHLMSQTLQPSHEGRLDQMMELFQQLIKQIPIYKLTCNMDDEAAYVAYHAMQEATGK